MIIPFFSIVNKSGASSANRERHQFAKKFVAHFVMRAAHAVHVLEVEMVRNSEDELESSEARVFVRFWLFHKSADRVRVLQFY